jgi:hypothetical protein
MDSPAQLPPESVSAAGEGSTPAAALPPPPPPQQIGQVPAAAAPPPTKPFLARMLLPEVYDPSFEGKAMLGVLRLLLYTAPLVLILDWASIGSTGILLLVAAFYAFLMLAYFRSLSPAQGHNPFRPPDEPAAKPYYYVGLAAAAALLLSPIIQLFEFSFSTRVYTAIATFVAIVVILFLARKVAHPGLVGRIVARGLSPLDVAQSLEGVV